MSWFKNFNWYILCKKYKVINWIDDYIVWPLWNKPKKNFNIIKHWFYCNWNKEHWRLVKSTIVSYPWDYFYMYKTMEYYIDQQLRWFNKHHEVEGCNENIIRPLNWAKHCLHIINNSSDLFEFDYNTNKHIYTGPYINYRNYDRFIKYQFYLKPNASKEYLNTYYKEFKEDYYVLKCTYMLHKILMRYSCCWWD